MSNSDITYSMRDPRPKPEKKGTPQERLAAYAENYCITGSHNAALAADPTIAADMELGAAINSLPPDSLARDVIANEMEAWNVGTDALRAALTEGSGE